MSKLNNNNLNIKINTNLATLDYKDNKNIEIYK